MQTFQNKKQYSSDEDKDEKLTRNHIDNRNRTAPNQTIQSTKILA